MLVAETSADDTVARDEDGDRDVSLDIDAWVTRVEKPPSWSLESSFVDVNHELSIVVRYGDLIAVHASASTRDALHRWLATPPLPPVRRLPKDVLESALLAGEAKGLWLRGTHARRSTKADAKNLSGGDLRGALNPFDDSSFALVSARSALPTDPSRTALKGTVGTTPKRSLVWNGPTDNFKSFVSSTIELLKLLSATLGSDSRTAAFPLLAQEQQDLSGVWGAYEITTLPAADVPPGPSQSDDERGAAELLERSMLDVVGDSATPMFELGVGYDMSISGKLRGRLSLTGDYIGLKFGLLGEPANPGPVLEIRDALIYENLLTVHYASGHTYTNGAIYRNELSSSPFPNWDFEDFRGFEISLEKPKTKLPTEIHKRIGTQGEPSLFSWVVRKFGADGWLTCDDGAGEAADFIHVSGTGVLSLIHVKGAKSNAELRRVAATAYEVVIGQAVKNVSFLNTSRLREHLESPSVAKPATWSNGQRTDDRREFIEALDCRDARDSSQVLIVQPHISEKTYSRLSAERERSTIPPPDLHRLNLLENMLNSARSAVVGTGADLRVVGSLA